MLGYRVPAPNEALLISGRKQRGADALQFKIVTGHGVFVMPILSRASTLTLAMQEAEVVEDCFTQQGLTLGVCAVIAFKVGDDHESIASAARRFQGDQSQTATESAVRSAIGKLSSARRVNPSHGGGRPRTDAPRCPQCAAMTVTRAKARRKCSCGWRPPQ